MKVKIDIEVKPDEIRTLIGLPDVQGIQDDLVEYIRGGMKKGVDTVEAVTMLRQFLPESLKTATALQQMFSKGLSKVLGEEIEADVEVEIEAKDSKSAAKSKNKSDD